MKIALVVLALGATLDVAAAATLRAAATGCATEADAARLATLGGKAAQDTAARPLLASRTCLAFNKGLAVDVDETKPPLSCVRLTGDLSCWWLQTALVDEHPGEKGGGGARRGGGRRH